ncbi:hypothetical protein STEG23_010011, partial [Scotinomys teguina]
SADHTVNLSVSKQGSLLPGSGLWTGLAVTSLQRSITVMVISNEEAEAQRAYVICLRLHNSVEMLLSLNPGLCKPFSESKTHRGLENREKLVRTQRLLCAPDGEIQKINITKCRQRCGASGTARLLQVELKRRKHFGNWCLLRLTVAAADRVTSHLNVYPREVYSVLKFTDFLEMTMK